MKRLILLFLISVVPLESFAQISRAQLTDIQAAFIQEYSAELAVNKSVLSINKGTPANPDMWWNLDVVHASYVTIREEGIRQHNLYVFGGYARLPGMTADGVVAVLCHELGHGIGGAPFKDNGEKELVSTEGQSDYFAYNSCLPRMFRRIPPATTPQAASDKIEQICIAKSSSKAELLNCYRLFAVLEIERAYFAEHVSTPSKTDYDTPDESVASKLNLDPYYYPSNQCRIDTMMAGYFKDPRPQCWFPKQVP